jgi:cell pole-organizing protein PopZ
MEDILASIRRILSEDEQPKPSGAGGEAKPAALDEAEVVALDESMLVAEPVPPVVEDASFVVIEPVVSVEPPAPPSQAAAPSEIPLAAPALSPPAAQPERLIAPEAEAAAAGAMSSLLRTLEAGQRQAGMAVHRGGPTLEDIVREEMRPLLKAWLDANLPPLVERLVRAEIERLVGRSLP